MVPSQEKDILLIDKQAGWTSFDIVAKIRGMIRARYQAQDMKPTKRQLKVGHTGTLDPFATGLVIVLLGDACSRSDEFLKLDKVYEATIKLGETSSTGDTEGEITAVSDVKPTREDIDKVAKQFVGAIAQVPPMHSAIKINGQRAYKLAREGKTVEMPTRTVTIYSLDVLDYTYPQLTIRTHVSSGTYIRTLAEDIGKSLGVGAYCQGLRRTKVGEYTIDNAKTIQELNIDNL
jgi:tRNA pseudouridine55 synthase